MLAPSIPFVKVLRSKLSSFPIEPMSKLCSKAIAQNRLPNPLCEANQFSDIVQREQNEAENFLVLRIVVIPIF